MNTVYTYDSVYELLTKMDTSRLGELQYYYKYLRSLRAAGDSSVWTNETWYDFYMDQILTYAKERPAYAEKYLEEILNQ